MSVIDALQQKTESKRAAALADYRALAGKLAAGGESPDAAAAEKILADVHGTPAALAADVAALKSARSIEARIVSPDGIQKLREAAGAARQAEAAFDAETEALEKSRIEQRQALRSKTYAATQSFESAESAPAELERLQQSRHELFNVPKFRPRAFAVTRASDFTAAGGVSVFVAADFAKNVDLDDFDFVKPPRQSAIAFKGALEALARRFPASAKTGHFLATLATAAAAVSAERAAAVAAQSRPAPITPRPAAPAPVTPPAAPVAPAGPTFGQAVAGIVSNGSGRQKFKR